MIEPHLNPNVRGLRPSATVAINDLSNELRAQGRMVHKLGLGQSPFPVPESVVAELRSHAHEKDYLPARGLAELREAVAAHHRDEFGVEASPEDVVIGPGSKELMFLLQLAFGGELVIPSPSWVSYAPQARILGHEIRRLPTSFEDRWAVDPEVFTELFDHPVRPRLLILNYPNNPTGLTMHPDHVHELARRARRLGAILLSDEIYAKLLFAEHPHRSALTEYPEGTIFSGGLSKWCGAGGWRLGVFVFPPQLRWLRDGLTAVATETFTSTSAPIQWAAVRAFRGGSDIEDYLARSRGILASLGAELARRLAAAGARIHPPDGGFYLFPDFGPLRESLASRGVTTSVELCHRLLDDTGVAVLPGSDFGRPPEELTVRLAYVDFDGTAALAAPAGDYGPGFLAAHCGDVLDAVDALVDWVTA